ncbi:hypothetical protein BDV93DRAFT_542299 [Ceratobasidium sp. AG-I]|nr:hypothetical protein BDV93DRAFT_542299 [Ceratobasidium sp. AG-I]
MTSRPVGRQLLAKRRRSIGEHVENPAESSSTKRPRLPPTVLASFQRSDASTSTPAAPSPLLTNASLKPKGTTTRHGSVRLRLGLQKRPNTSSRPAPEQSSDESYDVSVHVRMTPRRKLGAGPSRILAAETTERTDPESSALAFNLQLPAVTLPNKGDKFHLQFPVEFAAPGPSRNAQSARSLLLGQSTPESTAPRGVVLVPSSPSPMTGRISDIPATSLRNDSSWIDSRVSASVLYDSSEGSQSLPLHDTSSPRLFLPPPLPRNPTSTLGLNDSPRINDSGCQNPATSNQSSDDPTPDVLVSASLSLSLEESGSQLASIADSRINESPNLPASAHTTRYDASRQASSRMVTSVMYASSQELPDSQQSVATQDENGSASWNLSHLISGNLNAPPTAFIPPSLPPSKQPQPSRTRFSPSQISGGSESPDSILDNLDPPSPRDGDLTGLELISALYNSSQDAHVTGLQQTPLAHSSPPGHAEANENTATPVPSWSSQSTSSLREPRALSGARPTSSWSPRTIENASPDDLIAASRSLSLEDFEHQVHPPPKNLTSTSRHHAVQRSALTESPSRQARRPGPGPAFTAKKAISPAIRSGEPGLVQHVSTQDSISDARSSTPKLLSREKNVHDDSIESIDSPQPRRNVSVGLKALPAFRLPRTGAKAQPEDDDDDEISLDSEPVLRMPVRSSSMIVPPTHTHHGNPVPAFATRHKSDPKFRVPPDVMQAPALRSPVGSRLGTDITPAEKPIAPLSHIPRSFPPPHSALDALPSLPPQHPTRASKTCKGHLHSMIAQPHLFPSLACPPPSLTEGMLASLEAPHFQTWLQEDGTPAPDQAAAAERFTSDAWSRAAWIVPVRGRAPWEGCSAAVVSLRPIVELKKRVVVWTPAALRSLWKQLIGFRESQRLGPLSMSFEPEAEELAEEISEPKGSQAFEFIKIYHDARVSLKLRTILKVLEMVDEDGYGVDASVPAEDEREASTLKRRLLGSSVRLALVDETGRVVLIS